MKTKYKRKKGPVQSKKISYDSGLYWDELSTINSLRYPTKSSNISTDSLYFNQNYRISLKTNPKLNAYYYLSFKKFYYVYCHVENDY